MKAFLNRTTIWVTLVAQGPIGLVPNQSTKERIDTLPAIVQPMNTGELCHIEHEHEETLVGEPVFGRELEQLPPGLRIEFRTGLPPSSPIASDAGVLLAGFALRDGSGQAENSGVVGHVRIKNGQGRVIIQGEVTVGRRGGIIEVDNNVVVAGGTVTCQIR